MYSLENRVLVICIESCRFDSSFDKVFLRTTVHCSTIGVSLASLECLPLKCIRYIF